jgi:hypothetical protein
MIYFAKMNLFLTVFSLGMLMFELLSLERPYFDAVDRFEANEKVLNGVRPTFPKNCPGIDERFVLIDKTEAILHS